MSNSFIESCIEERHEYARHTLTSTVTWFTFFVVLNYGAMSWLAGSQTMSQNHYALILVACGFILQNILGIIACLIVRKYFFRSNKRILDSQALLLRQQSIVEDFADLGSQTCLPLRLYLSVVVLMIIALVPILAAWAVLIYLNTPGDAANCALL
jgi:hypothetical protein